MKRSSSLWSPSHLPLIAAACLFLSFSATVLAPGARPTSLWRGYYTLLLRAGSEAEKGFLPPLARLSAGSGSVISRDTAVVSFDNFSARERIAVSEIGRGLDELDPRLDPFLKGVPGYFEAGGRRILYVPAAESAASVFIKLARLSGAPGAMSWRLVEADPAKAVIAVLGAACAVLLMLLSEKKRPRSLPWLAVLFVSAWTPVLLQGGAGIIGVFFAAVISWFPLAAECSRCAEETAVHNAGWKDAAVRKILDMMYVWIIPAAALIAAYGIILGGVPRMLLSMAAAASVSLVLLAVPFTLPRTRRKRKQDRKSYKPLKPPRLSAALLTAAALCAAASAVLQFGRYSGLPAPRAVRGQGEPGWDWLETRKSEVDPDSLPDLAHAVAHAAFLESFAYGGNFGIPKRGEAVLLREYEAGSTEPGIREHLTVVNEFDEAWLRRVFAEAEPASVERLLLAQGGPAGVSRDGSDDIFIRDAVFALLCLAAAAARLILELRGRSPGPLITGVFLRFNVTPAFRRSRF